MKNASSLSASARAKVASATGVIMDDSWCAQRTEYPKKNTGWKLAGLIESEGKPMGFHKPWS